MQKIGITIILLLFFAQLTIQQHRETREQVLTQVNSNGNPFSFMVPDNEANLVKEYGFTFWVRPSYLAPTAFKFNTFITNDLGLAGIHENTLGYCPESDGRYGQALNIMLQRGEYSNVPTYVFNSYNQLDPNDERRVIEFPSREDFDNQWNFVYATYSYVESKAYAYVYFGYSDSTQSVQWMNSQKRDPAPAIKFRLGGCDPNTQATFQGYFHNVQFFYGPVGSNMFLGDQPHVQQFRVSANNNFLQQEEAVAVIEPAIGNDIITFSANSDAGQQNVYQNLNGPEEYAVWGWAQWTEPAERSREHLLFRLTSDEPGEFQDEDKVGDRTLACFIQEGSIGFSTYTFHFSGTQVETNYFQEIDYQDQIGLWFFTYFGYSNSLHQAYAYVKFDQGEVEMTWDNVYHMLPNKMVLQLGKDDFHRGFNGDMKNWNFGYGPGTYSYVTLGFESLYNSEKVDLDGEWQMEELYPAESYESNLRQVEPVYRFDVPQEELQTVEDVSVSLWFKFSYQYPAYANIEDLKTNKLSLLQVSETGRHGTNVGDRLLSVWLLPLLYGRKTYELSSYAVNMGRPNWSQDCNVRDPEDFDSAWTWLYFAYTPSENALFSYMRFASGEVVTLNWEDAVHNYPPQGLHFSVGKAENQPFSFNGFIYNVQFNYEGWSYLGTREDVDEYFYNRVTSPDMTPRAYHDELILPAETTFVDSGISEGEVYSTYDGSNAQEYAAYGWFKWETTGAIQSQHALFRLTTNEESQVTDNDKPADRTLVYYISEGVLVANTYTYSFTSPDFSVKHSTPYEDDLESWFWVYFGYDYAQKRAVSFIRFYDRVEQFVFNGLVHQLPHRFRFTVGNDRYMNSFNGKIRDVHLAWGVGAYQPTGLETLYGVYVPLNQPEILVDNFWTQEAVLINSNAEEESEYEVVVDRAAINEVTQYSFSFWWRFSFQDPQKISIQQMRENWIALAGVTERDGYYEGGMGGKALSCYMRPLGRSTQPTLYFSTYATNRDQDDDFKDMPFSFDDLDSQWNWMSFGYDLDLQRAYAAVVFGSGVSRSLDWEQTVHQHPSELKFQLGRARGDQALGFNGQFYDVRFRFDNLAYKEGANVGTYFSTSIVQPPNFSPLYARVPLTDFLQSVNVDQNTVSREVGFATRFRGARQYSIYGWAKWTESSQREPIHSLFRLTTNTPSNQGNLEHSSDRTLACFVSQTQLVFATYTFGEQGGDNWNVLQSIDFDDDLTAWFFVYFGYDKTVQRARAFVQFQDRQVQLTFDNINHAVPRYVGSYLGKDQFYPSFNGQLKGWILSAGQGAYQETDFEALMVEEADDSENAYYESATNVVQDEEHPIVTLYEEDIHEYMLQEMTTVTAWTWFQWNYNIPEYFGNPSLANDQCYHIFRLIKGSNEGQFTDLCFTQQGIPYVKLTEILGGVENTQLSELPSFDDLDGSWNFVYWSHNEATQTTVAYVYYSNAQQRFVYTFQNSVWNFPNEYIRLKLGGGVTSTNGRRLFNGRFFDAQVSTFSDYHQTDEVSIGFVQTIITIIPNQYNDDEVDDTPRRLSFTLREDGLVETDDSTNQPVFRQITQYTNLKKYAVYGWVRWVGQRDTTNAVRIIYRVNQHILSESGDATQPGDRSLTLFLTETGRLRFSTYNFDGDDSNYDLSNEVDLDVAGYLQKWFFVYHGYSYEQRRNYFYIRFADGTEFEHQMDHIRHVQSGYYGVYLGRDWIYQPWRGQFYAFGFQVGGLTYVQTLEEVRVFQQLATTSVIIPTEFDENIVPVGGDIEEAQSDANLESDEQGYDRDEEANRQRIANETNNTVVRGNELGWVTTNDTTRATIEGNTFTNRWSGFSYFFDEFSLDQQYKITIVSGVAEGSKICFGYIPLEMVDSLKQLDSTDERYSEYSISICSDNEVNQCQDGAGNCTGGLFDQRPRSTFLWSLEEEIAVVKQIVVEGNEDCQFLSDDSEEQQNYVLDDHCTYRDTVYNYYFRQNRRTRSYPFECRFGRKVVCLRDHEFEVEWVPYIELRGDIVIELNRDAFGEYDVVDESDLPCGNITNTTTVQISCPAPPPRRCDDQFDLSQLPSQDWFGVLNEEISARDLINDGQYVSLENGDGNYFVTLNEDVPNGEVCFGYITREQELEFLSAPTVSFTQNTISVCTNGAKNNFGSPSLSQVCVGRVPFVAGTRFNVTVQLDFVQITDVQTRYFQCNFTRAEFRDDLIPWISLSRGATVIANMSGIGQIEDLDCGYPPLPEPPIPPRTCDDMFNPVEVNNAWFSAAVQNNVQGPRFTSINGEQLVSPQNPNANYLITFVDEVPTGQFMCFGYVNANTISVSDMTPGGRLTETLSVCTDGNKRNFYSVEPQNVLCQGVMNRTAGSSFNVTVQWNSIQITASDQHWQCNLWYDNTVGLVPWVYASGAQTFDVQQTGVGKVDSRDCIWPFVFLPRTCGQFFDTSYLTDSSWFYTATGELTTGAFVEPLQYVSYNNKNANYELTLEVPNTDICFGYILKNTSQSAVGQTLNLQQSFSVCTDGTISDPNAECYGEVPSGYQQKFNLTVQPDWVQITSFDRYFQCNISTPTDDVVPWVQLRSGEAAASLTGVGKVLCFYYPFYRRVCSPDFTDDHQLSDWSWFDRRTGNETESENVLNNTVAERYNQYVSKNNNNANYNITINSDFVQGKDVCFGYIESARLETEWSQYNSFEAESVSVCTNGNHNNGGSDFLGECFGTLLYTANAQFKVTVLLSSVQITQMDSHFQCNFIRQDLVLEFLVPWVQVHGEQSINVLLWGIGFIECPTPYEPLIIAPVILTLSCQQDMFDITQLTNQNWMSAIDVSEVSTSTLINNGGQQYKSFLSFDNLNANYLITLDNTYAAQGIVCFGFVLETERNEVNQNPFSSQSISLCTDNTKHNYDQNPINDIHCQGEFRVEPGNQFNVTVLWEKIQITSLPERFFQCNFTRNSRVEVLVPWVQIQSLGQEQPSVDVELTGRGKIYNDGAPEDCGYGPFLPPPPIIIIDFVPTCENSFYNQSLVTNQLWTNDVREVEEENLSNSQTQDNFISVNNTYGNFNLTLTADQVLGGKVCFGVIPYQSINMAFDGDSPNTNFTQGICTTGQTMNFAHDRTRDTCQGLHNLKNTSGTVFTVLVNAEKIQITQDDFHVHCEFFRDDYTVRLFPWVFIKSPTPQTVNTNIFGIGNVDGTTCNNHYEPLIVPPPPPPPIIPPEYVYPINCTRQLMDDTSSITDDTWQSTESRTQEYTTDEIRLNSADSDLIEFYSIQNGNRNFEVELNSNVFSQQRRHVCFGYAPRSSVTGGLNEETISLCTNGEHSNFAGGAVECTNSVLLQKALSRGTTFRVDLLWDKVQISTTPFEETFTQCNITFRTNSEQQFSQFVPWIQIRTTIGVVKVTPTLKGLGLYPDPFQACPTFVGQFEEPTCYPDFYDPNHVRDTNWASSAVTQQTNLASTQTNLNFVSSNNPDTNFNITVPLSQGRVCFGFVSSNALPLAASNLDFSVRSNTISFCVQTDTTFTTNSFELNGNDRNVEVKGAATFSLTRTPLANKFLVYLNTHRVQISSADRQFQINFNRSSAALQVFPWVQFSASGQTAEVVLYGIGKIDGNVERVVEECNIEFVPPLECPFCLDERGQCVECEIPPLHLCSNSFWNETLAEQVWYKPSTRTDLVGSVGESSTDSEGNVVVLAQHIELEGSETQEYETFVSPLNRNGNYEIWLENDFVGGSICFGFIKASQEDELYLNEGSFHRSTISLCTNGLAYNVFSGSSEDVFDTFCRGRLPTNQGSQYKILAGHEQIQITSFTQKDFQCNFTIPASFGFEQNLLPWVQIQTSSSLLNSARVAVIGSGRPVDIDVECDIGFRPIPFTCAHQFYNEDLVNNVWYKSLDRSTREYQINQAGQYLSEYNQNGNYNITLEPTGESKTCFGFLPQRFVNNFFGSTPSSDDLFLDTISICNDGTQNNVEGEYTCTGNMNAPGSNQYIVTVLADSVQITAANNHYQCNFLRNRENKNLLPWILTTSATTVDATVFGLGMPDENDENCMWRYIPPVIVPIYVTCENSFYNISKVSERWESASAKGIILSSGTLQGVGQYLSPNNSYGNYEIEFDNNAYTLENYLCFGYVQRAHLTELYDNPEVSSLQSAMALCTNGRGYNYQDSENAFAQCLGDFRKTNSSLYIVTVRRNNVQITANNSHLQCNLTLAVDDNLVPWIQTTSDLPVQVRFFGQGRPDQNEPNCTLPYDPLPLTPPPPPPRTCEDFYTYKDYELEDMWVTTLTDERLQEGRLFNNDPVGLEFVSPNNDTNYRFQIHEFTGLVCFGYVQLGGTPDEAGSTSICFDEDESAYYTHGFADGVVECAGNFTHATGSTFNVTVQESNVSITHTHRIFQCNFTRQDNTPILQPYVKIGEQANIEYRLLSIGKHDCPEYFTPLPPPPPKEYICNQSSQNNQWKHVNPEGSAVRIITTLDNDATDYHSEFYSDNEGNFMASFTVQLSPTYAGNKVCFGYVNKDNLFEITSNPGFEHSLNAVSVCTDGTHYPSSGTCEGVLNAVAGETFQVHLDGNLIQFQSTSVADRFQCSFDRDQTQVYVPWAEIHGIESIEVAFTGCEIVVTRDCRDFVDASQTVPEWQDATSQATYVDTFTSTPFNSFGSNNNVNANYEISFVTVPTTGSVCFGYTSVEDWARVQQTPASDNSDKANALCFVNGGIQEFNAYGSGSCQGKPRLQAGSTFFVTVQNNQTQITTLPDKHFQCNFGVPEGLNLVPWIQISGDNVVTTQLVGIGKLWCPEVYIGYETPPPITCLNRTWNGPVPLNEEAVFTAVGPVSQYVQQVENRDESFEVVLNQDHVEGRLCFGFLSQTQASEVETDQTLDVSASANGVCTDQPAGPAHGLCSGEMVLTTGSRFLVYTKNGRFTVQEDDPITGYPVFQCYFTATEQGLPWIELRQTSETVTAQMTCTSYETPVPPVYVCSNRTWSSNVLSYEPTLDVLSVESGNGQFAQPDNVNENYTVQILETQADNYVCFGYVPRDSYNPSDVNVENTLSFCTNNVNNNPYGEVYVNCEGTVNIQRGQEFWVSVNQDGNRVTVRQPNDEFRCDFNGPVQGYVPFVHLQEVTQLQATVNCDVFPDTPPPVPRTCDTDFFDEAQLNDREWSSAGEVGYGRDNSFGPLLNSAGTYKDYVSQNNSDANYDLTFTQAAINGKVCFGFVPSSELPRVNTQQEPLEKISVCSDGSFENYQNSAASECRGRVQYVEGTVYHVYVNVERIQITANDNHFQCDFPTVSQEPLVPWVSLSGAAQSVSVYLTGVGRLSGANCELVYVPLVCPQAWTTRSNSGQVDVTQATLSNPGGQVANFLSAHNLDNQFTVTLESDQSTGGYVCFGYIPQSLHRVVQGTPDASYYSSALAVCTDGTQYSYLGDLQLNCQGTLQTEVGTTFYVSINETTNEVNIGDSANHFHCEYTRNEEERLMPWVGTSGNLNVNVQNTCTPPTRFPTPIPPPPPIPAPTCADSWDHPELVSQAWYPAFSYQRTFTFDNYLVSQRSETTHFVADDEQNLNGLYMINLNEDYDPDSKVCFGYITPSTRALIPSEPFEDLADSAVGLCTDGTLHNPMGSITCNQEFTSTWPSFNEGTLYRVINYENSVGIWSSNGEVQCNFTKTEEVDLVPWVQFSNVRSASVELTGRGGFPYVESCEDPPVFVCTVIPEPEPSDCAVLFSQCNFSGVQFNMCDAHGHEELPADQQGAVLSLYLPPGSRVNLGCVDDGQINCGAKSLEFAQSEPCLDHDEVFHRNIRSAEFIQLNKKPQDKQLVKVQKKQYLTKNRR